MDTTEIGTLIQQVKYGRMTPEAAEAEAVRLRHGNLAGEPPEGTFDPMGETWWTLPMTVAWIAWRTPKFVRAWWPEFRRNCWDWHFREWRNGPEGTVHSGHFLERRRDANLNMLRLSETYNRLHELLPAKRIPVREAQSRLWDALADGMFEGYGIDTTTGLRTTIPSSQWRSLEHWIERERDVLRLRSSGVVSPVGYDEIELRRQNIMARWPPHRREEWDRPLPPPIPPEGPGYMPLCCAAHWLATKGGTESMDLCGTPAWEQAFSELLARISSDDVAITGVRDGEREKIPGHVFANISVHYPWCDSTLSDDLYLSNELYLFAGAYLDEEHWQRGFDDRLESGRGVKWGKLLVLKADVARWWPFAGLGDNAAPAGPEYYTGAPGRPTSMQLVELEHSSRWDRGEASKRIGAEAKELAHWLMETHPNAPWLTVKTIANRLRKEHRCRASIAQK